MEQIKIAEQDYGTWAEAARTNPRLFEEMRQAAIDDYIQRAPVEMRQRLRGLQWRVDQERRLSRSPLGACVRISRMMWRQVLGPDGLRDRLQELTNLVSGRNEALQVDAERPKAEVLAFAGSRD